MATPEILRQKFLNSLHCDLFTAICTYGFSEPKMVECAADPDDDTRPRQLLCQFSKSIVGAGADFAIIEVAVKPFWRPTFSINAGRYPSNGFKLNGIWDENISPESVTVSMLEEQAKLQISTRKEYSPFVQPLWAYLIGSDKGISDIIKKAVDLLPELMNWMNTGVPPEYVWVTKFWRAEK